MNWIALLPTGIAVVGVLALAVRWVLKSSPTVAEMVDDTLDHASCRRYWCPVSQSIECCGEHGGWDVCCDAPELHEVAVVAGSDLDPLERLLAAPAYGEER
jgi:hypothetical protein